MIVCVRARAPVCVCGRIINMRTLLVNKLKENGSTKDWSHITDQVGCALSPGSHSFSHGKLRGLPRRAQIGMFAFSGLTKAQVETLRYDTHLLAQPLSL